MHGDDPMMNHRLKNGSPIDKQILSSIHSAEVPIPDPDSLVHLQFRRFAGCPVCDLHLHSISERHRELASASIREVVVFHSPKVELLKYCAPLPFDVIADPEKRLYDRFGVGSSPHSLLSPSAWTAIVKGILRSFGQVLRRRTPLPTLNPPGGRFGLPADFLISPAGLILACKYGTHAYDQWSVDEILALVRSVRIELGPFSESNWHRLNRQISSMRRERLAR